MIKKVFLLLAVLVFGCSVPVSAVTAPYQSYVYDNQEQVLPTQIGYVPVQEITGEDLGVGAFNKPEDFFVDQNHDLLYVSDTGNNRVLVFDKQLNLVKTIDAIQTESLPDGLRGVVGLYVDEEENLYLAQRDANNVAIVDKNGILINYLNKPGSELFPNDNMFEPKKVLCDKAGRVLVLVRGIYQGAVVFDKDGNFQGFYGGNRVEQTAEVIANFLWRRFMTEEQIAASAKTVPTEYDNFCINGDFIYTVSQTNVTPDERIKKLNPGGVDVMNEDVQFGDLEAYEVNATTTLDTTFNDITVDDEGYIYALDLTRGRVFQYDAEGTLLFTYGGIGSQTGTFRQPVAIEKWGEYVLVLDQLKGTITFFEQTEFGEAVLDAVSLYNKGLYQEAEVYWQEVLRFDSNYQLAYDGIGKSMYNQARYEEACDYFKTSKNQEWYSKSFQELRIINMRKAFPYVLAGVIVLAVGIVVFGKLRKRKKQYGKAGV